MNKLLPFLFLSISCMSDSVAQKTTPTNYFSKWTTGTSPQEIGQRLSTRFLSIPHGHGGEGGHSPNYITYPEVCAWYGALTFAQLTQNKALQLDLVKRFDKLKNEETAFIPTPDHVDYTVFGTVPLEIALQFPEQKQALSLGLFMADAQWVPPFGPQGTAQAQAYYEKGLSWQTRVWIDDMYMITMIQTQAYRATKNIRYLNRAAKEMVFYLDEIQRPNGLFYHAPDVPFFWGRGNGWMAAGMAELLRVLPSKSVVTPVTAMPAPMQGELARRCMSVGELTNSGSALILPVPA